MKNLKKVLAVMTAVATISMSASAFAANTGAIDEDSIKGAYNGSTNEFTITAPATYTGDATILVLKPGALDDEVVADDEIVYINQAAADPGFGTMGFKLAEGQTEVEPGTYTVRIGWDDGTGFEMREGDLVIAAEGSGEEGKKITLCFGDIDGDGEAKVGDAGLILNKLAGGTATFTVNGAEYTIGGASGPVVYGDIDGDGEAKVGDAGLILNKLAGGTATFTKNGVEYTIGTAFEFEAE